MSEIYKLLASQLSNQGSKTNIVRPLIYLMGVLLASSIFLFQYNIEIAGYIVLGAAGVVLLSFLVIYFICLFTNPDLLRSEKFVLEKTAIERTAQIGDSNYKATILPPDSEFVIFHQEDKI